MATLLEIDHVTMCFGGLCALEDVSFTVDQGEIIGLIGPNGAGKTTIFNVITGFHQPTEGKVRFKNREIQGLGSHRITGTGICRTFQTIRLFSRLSVLENVLIGTHRWSPVNWLEPMQRLFRGGRYSDAGLERARLELEMVGLWDRAGETVGNLPYGDQRRVELARAMASKPELLLLDEPAAGMNPQESGHLREIILKVLKRDVSVLLIEHQMKLVMGISHRVVVLNYGAKIADGTPEAVQRDEQVIQAYLGDTGHALARD